MSCGIGASARSENWEFNILFSSFEIGIKQMNSTVHIRYGFDKCVCFRDLGRKSFSGWLITAGGWG